jgi:hypothetical protein
MTTLHWFWIASAAGALFFFAAGYFLARRRAPEVELELGPVRQNPPPLPIRIRTPDPADGHNTSESLAALLDGLQSGGRCDVRAVALSDDLGLPIVGVGDDVSSLAAFAGYMGDIGKRAGDFLPLGPVRRVTVEDESGATITACPFDAGAARIALVALTAGPGPTPRQVSEVLRSAASMIQ